MANRLKIAAAFGLVLLLGACAAGFNPMEHTPRADQEIYGFWHGLWQGIILPYAFIGSLIDHHVNIYEVHNNGGWYNFGFVLGAGGGIKLTLSIGTKAVQIASQ